LDVVETATIKRTTSGNNMDLNFYNGSGAGTAGNVSRIRSDGDGISNDYGALSFWTGRIATAAITERMRIDSSGNVGIGTASPAAKLEISGASAAAQAIGTRITNTTATGLTSIELSNGSANMGQIWAGNGSYASFGGAGSLNYSANSGPHVWYTNYAERARIDSSGQLGINTTSPAKTLDVNGTVQFRDAAGAGQAFWVANKGVGSTNSGAFGLGYNAVNFTPASLPSALLWDGNTGWFTINTSSRKYKENIVAVTDEQLDKALLLKPSYYQRKEQQYFEYGFIAEEVNEIGLDEFVTRVEGEISGLAYDKMVTLAIGLAQRQAKEIANLVAELQSVRQRLAALEA
jgi:hypothetical protein